MAIFLSSIAVLASCGVYSFVEKDVIGGGGRVGFAGFDTEVPGLFVAGGGGTFLIICFL
jgi:hypothetical protein